MNYNLRLAHKDAFTAQGVEYMSALDLVEILAQHVGMYSLE